MLFVVPELNRLHQRNYEQTCQMSTLAQCVKILQDHAMDVQRWRELHNMTVHR